MPSQMYHLHTNHLKSMLKRRKLARWSQSLIQFDPLNMSMPNCLGAPADGSDVQNDSGEVQVAQVTAGDEVRELQRTYREVSDLKVQDCVLETSSLCWMVYTYCITGMWTLQGRIRLAKVLQGFSGHFAVKGY